MTDVIKIRGLRAPARIGVTDEERGQEQMLVIDLDIETDLTSAAHSDHLGDTVDYDATITQVAALVRASECKLLEHLAEQIARVVGRSAAVDAVTVEIAKANPPIGEVVDNVAVRIERRGR